MLGMFSFFFYLKKKVDDKSYECKNLYIIIKKNNDTYNILGKLIRELNSISGLKGKTSFLLLNRFIQDTLKPKLLAPATSQLLEEINNISLLSMLYFSKTGQTHVKKLTLIFQCVSVFCIYLSKPWKWLKSMLYKFHAFVLFLKLNYRH